MILLTAGAARTQTYPEINGTVLFGYQGWFTCPGGAGLGSDWTHWSYNGAPTGSNMQIDMYPDLSEIPIGDLCQTGMTVQGQTAYLYSPENPVVVNTHFKWMQTYGLDGILLQRFLADIPLRKSTRDTVLQNVMNAAKTYGRDWMIEYDVSGIASDSILSRIQTDWQYLVDQWHITTQPGYLHHNGLPMVAVWGMGLNDGNHPATPQVAAGVISWFHTGAAAQYRASYLGGVPSWWRALTNDAFTDTAWSAVYNSMDIVQPWLVGRFSALSGADNWFNVNLKPDEQRTVTAGNEYQPVIFPGFSSHNLSNGADSLNQIPRLGGAFLWEQAVNAIKSGAPLLKIAMFDEVNEGTAMEKLAARRTNAPDRGSWVALDIDGDTTLPSDWYLRLAGEITQMVHGTLALTTTIPIKPTDPWVGIASSSAGHAVPGLQVARVSAGFLFTGVVSGSEIQIVNLQGREMRKLIGAANGALWDGRDNSGLPLSHGIYYARFAKPSSIAFSCAALPFVVDGE